MSESSFCSILCDTVEVKFRKYSGSLEVDVSGVNWMHSPLPHHSLGELSGSSGIGRPSQGGPGRISSDIFGYSTVKFILAIPF